MMMASPSGSGSGTCSGSGSSLSQSQMGNSLSLSHSHSQSEEDLQALMNRRKQKRMLSNRESARRSRMRKQKHLDDLTAQVSHLRKENAQILTALSVTTQHYVGVEAENSVLRAQIVELTATLHSLDQILHYVHGIADDSVSDGRLLLNVQSSDSLCSTMPWSMMNQQPIMASSDMFHYC